MNFSLFFVTKMIIFAAAKMTKVFYNSEIPLQRSALGGATKVVRGYILLQPFLLYNRLHLEVAH